MPKVICFTRLDGSVCVVHQSVKERDRLGMTEDEFIDWLITKDVPRGATNVVVVDSSTLPPRNTRNLWEQKGVTGPTPTKPLPPKSRFEELVDTLKNRNLTINELNELEKLRLGLST